MRTANRPLVSHFIPLVCTILVAVACSQPAVRASGGSTDRVGTAVVGPPRGTVIVVGGGAMGPEIYRAFIEAAGGPDANIVVIPTAGEDSIYPANWSGLNGFKAAGARHLTVLHTRDRAVANTDSFTAPIRSASGVWFPGGRQWHLVDSYADTKTERELHAVLSRGGVVGGSSAGASILASYLLRGAREGNTILMAPGYEKGFGFLRNTAIDQHVVARDRLADMPQVLAKHPALLGISEDEGTAWVVRGDQAEIIGRNKAFVYGGRDANDAGQPYLTLHPGDRYDLNERRVTHRASADSPLTAAFIDSVFEAYSGAAPGAAVLVAVDGRIVVDRAYGMADVASKTPVTTRTNFRLASVTKQFTAAATLLLVKDGKLRLEESLNDVFPDLPAYTKRITIKQLLTHTSGLLAYEDFVPDSQTRQVTDADVIAILRSRTDSTYFTPGTHFRYSNTGYAVLSEIIAKRSGIPFATFVRNRIFVPLGMHKSLAYVKGGPAIAFRAYGHSATGTAWRQTDQSNTSAVLGDGGVYTSVDELYRWDQALYTNELLPQELLKQAFTDQPLADGKKSGYGFGWFVDSYRRLPRISHTGTTTGFRTMIARFPTMHVAIIVLTNRSEPSPDSIVQRITDRLFFSEHDARWSAQSVKSTSSCRSLSAVSVTVAWAGCTGGKIFRTVDGGTTWHADSVPGAARLDFRGIKAFDANTAVAVSAGPAEQGQARIYRTTDGAKTWTLTYADTTKGIFFDGVAFWDAQHGFTFSDPLNGKFVILTTDDGGVHWSAVPPANIPPVLPREAAFAASNTQLTVQGDRNAWIASGGGATARVFRTTDRGRTWTVHDTGIPGGASAGLFGIAFADARNGVAIGGDYAIERGVSDVAIRTTDGGVTWQRAGTISRPDGVNQGLHLIPGSRPARFVAVGAYGTAFSDDFGATWQHGDTLTAWGVGFATPDVGWVAGPRGHIAKFTGIPK